jgi:hypothetical protein
MNFATVKDIKIPEGSVSKVFVGDKILWRKSSGKKNLFYRDYEGTRVDVGITHYWDADNQELVINGTTISTGDLRLVDPLKLDWEIGEMYTVSVRRVGGSATLPGNVTGTTFSWSIFSNDAKQYLRGGNLAMPEFPEVFYFTGKAFEAKGYVFYLQSWKPGTVFDNYRVKVQIEKGTEVTDWEAHRVED